MIYVILSNDGGCSMRRVLASVALLALAACSGGVDGPVIEGNRRSGGEDAEVSGIVQIDGDCVYVRQPETGTRYPVIWPRGTGWDADEQAIDLPGQRVLRDGDVVSGGGGYHHAETLDRYTNDEGVELALRCVDNDYGEIAVFNSNATDLQVGE